MSDKSFFDTNVILCAFREDDRRHETARTLLARGGLISVQVLNEFASVARRKLAMSWTEIFRALAALRRVCPSPVPLTLEVHERGLQIAEQYGYRIYDSLLIAAALRASCTVLYSEDMHDGHIIEGLTIRNPFQRIN